ncbi:hypothetical protein NLI96_g10560 [Meripilus lineatus]|uniref:Uncharacterized protein n=1 Tax=Meripilus lineatus TaxID=2056292 RepID=A0AAD5UUV7_9APHY|nr:hypothetical protein NLI96_g10560 [Physisporinus lineatus]
MSNANELLAGLSTNQLEVFLRMSRERDAEKARKEAEEAERRKKEEEEHLRRKEEEARKRAEVEKARQRQAAAAEKAAEPKAGGSGSGAGGAWSPTNPCPRCKDMGLECRPQTGKPRAKACQNCATAQASCGVMSGARKRKRASGEQAEKGKGKSVEVIEESEPEEEENRKKTKAEDDEEPTMKDLVDDIAEGIHLLVDELKGIRKEMRFMNRALADMVAG